jgi:hypothetical protein
VKERAAVFLAGNVHIDAARQSQFGDFDSDFSEIRLGHEGRSRVESVFLQARSLARWRREEAVLDRCETISNFLVESRIGPTKLG